MIKFEVTVLLKTCCYTVDMSTPATEVIDFIQQFVEQQEGYQGACFSLTSEKGYYSVESGARHHFVTGLIIHLDDKTVQMEITKGHHIQALAPLHQYVLGMHRGLRRAEVLSSTMKIQDAFFTQSCD